MAQTNRIKGCSSTTAQFTGVTHHKFCVHGHSNQMCILKGITYSNEIRTTLHLRTYLFTLKRKQNSQKKLSFVCFKNHRPQTKDSVSFLFAAKLSHENICSSSSFKFKGHKNIQSEISAARSQPKLFEASSGFDA